MTASTARRVAAAAHVLVGSLCAIASGQGLAEETARCGRDGVVQQTLGSGRPELQDGRASSSYLVWTNGVARVLVDAGGGSALRFGQSGATMREVEVILLTHLHADHSADLPALVKSSFFEDRTGRLPILGPGGNADFPSTTRFVHTLFAAPAGAYRYLAGFLDADGSSAYQLVPRDLTLGRTEIRPVYDANGLKVYATRVVHGGVPAIAYRVETGGARIAFSGDTSGENGNLERLARDVDILVAHNAVRDGATGIERALHMPPAVIGRIARDAAVRRLVLSHRMLRTLGHEAETEASIRAAYAGSVTFANDLDCIPIR